jgi:hypothetical protein
MNDARLSFLLSRHLDNQLTPAERAELEGILRSSSAARTQFWRETRLHGLLHEVENDAVGTAGELTRVASGPTRRTRQSPRWLRTALTIAATAASVMLLVAVGRQLPTRPAPTVETTTAAVAALSRVVDVTWSDAKETRSAGSPLEPGWLRLKAGLVEVDFFSGARVVLEGPAELQLLSSTEAYCHAGRLSAEVPPQARGFIVTTPQIKVVDRGTAFGIDVQADGAEVHVIKGRVELHEKSTAQRDLNEAEAVAVTADGRVRSIPANPGAFALAGEVERRASEVQRQQLRKWREAGGRWNVDPALVVRFDFEQLSPNIRVLSNVADYGRAAGDGSIVGCGQTEGRWPGKRALEFRSMSDRVRVSVAGTLRSFTLVAWIRVDGLDRSYNSLFMCESYETGGLHWQITQAGWLQLGVQGLNNTGGYDYRTPVLFTADRFGQWVHLTSVFDAGNHRVTNYVDGVVVSREATRFELPLRIGSADLGNWSIGARNTSYPVRHFSGLVDEFLLYQRALGDEEIAALYELGRPKSRPLPLPARTAAAARPSKLPACTPTHPIAISDSSSLLP